MVPNTISAKSTEGKKASVCRPCCVSFGRLLTLPRKLIPLLLATASTSATETVTPLRIFSGEPRLIVVNGYSTSNHWPHLFKRKLDRFLGENHPLEVKLALRGGTPIAKWMDIESR